MESGVLTYMQKFTGFNLKSTTYQVKEMTLLCFTGPKLSMWFLVQYAKNMFSFSMRRCCLCFQRAVRSWPLIGRFCSMKQFWLSHYIPFHAAFINANAYK